MKKVVSIGLVAGIGFMSLLAGCGSGSSEEKTKPAVEHTEHDGHDHSGHEGHNH